MIPAEADQAREFRNLAARIAAGKGSADDFVTARRWLTIWRDNDAALAPLLPASALTAELAPVSRNLSAAAIIGLKALSAIQRHRSLSHSTQDSKELKVLSPASAELTDMVLPGVEDLLVAASRN